MRNAGSWGTNRFLEREETPIEPSRPASRISQSRSKKFFRIEHEQNPAVSHDAHAADDIDACKRARSRLYGELHILVEPVYDQPEFSEGRFDHDDGDLSVYSLFLIPAITVRAPTIAVGGGFEEHIEPCGRGSLLRDSRRPGRFLRLS